MKYCLGMLVGALFFSLSVASGSAQEDDEVAAGNNLPVVVKELAKQVKALSGEVAALKGEIEGLKQAQETLANRTFNDWEYAKIVRPDSCDTGRSRCLAAESDAICKKFGFTEAVERTSDGGTDYVPYSRDGFIMCRVRMANAP